MTVQIFNNVWYRPNENRWRDMNLLAYSDIGTLIVDENFLEFKGKRENVHITNIRQISCGIQGRDFVNYWVTVDYDTDKRAFFADGSLLGCGGVFGGTRRILQAVKCNTQVSSIEKELKSEQEKKTQKPIVAGILDIINSCFVGIVLILMVLFASDGGPWDIPTALEFVALFALVGLGFVGGVVAILREKWKLALAGSIIVFLFLVSLSVLDFQYSNALKHFPLIIVFDFPLPLLIGMIPIILTALSKNEFK
jgi:hypothetical protein